MWNMTSQKNGISALGLQRILGLGSYRTAWLMLHKLRQAMVRPGRERLRGVVEVDETYWGTMESDGATGRRVLNKAMIIVAAEADGRGIGRIRMARIPDFDRKTLHGFIRESVKAGSTICTDGLNSYRELEGYVHDRKVQRHQPEGDKLLPRVHLAVSLLKRWMLGTHQGSFFGDFRGICFKRRGSDGVRVYRRGRGCGFCNGGSFGSRGPRILDLESCY